MVNESWRNSKDERKVTEYWKKTKRWAFDMNTGERLELFALTKQGAINSAKRHEKWLHSRGFKKDRVILSSVRMA